MSGQEPNMTALEICMQLDQMKMSDEQYKEVMVTVMAYFMRTLTKNNMSFDEIMNAVEQVYQSIK